MSCLGKSQLLLLASDSEFRFLMPQKHEGTTVMGFVSTPSLKIDVFDLLVDDDDIFLFWIDTRKLIQKLKINVLSETTDDTMPLGTHKHIEKREVSDEAITIVMKHDIIINCTDNNI